jgi:hypothetical protein
MKLAINGWLDGFGQEDEDGRLYISVADAEGFLMRG